MIDKYGLDDDEEDDAQPENDNDDDDDDDDGEKLKKLVQHYSSCAINIHLICYSIGQPPYFTTIAVWRKPWSLKRSSTVMVRGEAYGSFTLPEMDSGSDSDTSTMQK